MIIQEEEEEEDIEKPLDIGDKDILAGGSNSQSVGKTLGIQHKFPDPDSTLIS